MNEDGLGHIHTMSELNTVEQQQKITVDNKLFWKPWQIYIDII